MNSVETRGIDVYPWATPTAEQRAWFDGLSADAKRKVILDAIAEGFDSSVSSKTIDEIIRDAR